MQKINLKLTHKLAGLVGLCLLTIILVAGSFLMVNRNLMTDDRMDKVQNLVESAHSIVAANRQQVLDGEMTEEQAKAVSLATLEQMRYGDNGYLVIERF